MYDYLVRGHDIFFRIMSHPQYCDMTAGNSADNSARLPMGSGIRPNYLPNMFTQKYRLFKLFKTDPVFICHHCQEP